MLIIQYQGGAYYYLSRQIPLHLDGYSKKRYTGTDCKK